MNKPSVSIIVPVYNVEPYVEDCIRSVMRQTYTGSMECIVVDDCGTDNGIAIIEKLISDYCGPIRFMILHHEQNLGLSAARNTGTLQAIGDYLYYIDSDDEITEDCIETLVGKVIEYPDVEMVQGNAIRHITPNESYTFILKILSPLAKTNAEVRRYYYQDRQMMVNVWNKLIRRDFVINNKLYCKEGILFEDQLWTFYLLKHLKKVAYEKEITYHWKRRPFSITTGTDDKTSLYHYNIVYREMLNNLSEGFEKEELDFITWCISGMLVKYGFKSTGCKDIHRLCWDMNKVYGNRVNRILLVVSSLLGRLKYGWLIWRIMLQLKYPSRIPNTVRRLWKRLLIKLSAQ